MCVEVPQVPTMLIKDAQFGFDNKDWVNDVNGDSTDGEHNNADNKTSLQAPKMR